MTNKEYIQIGVVIIFIVGLFIGLFIGSLITARRYDSEIRTDQLELKDQIEEIMDDDATIQDIIKTLLFQVEQLKKERQEVRELRLLLSKGE